MTKELGVFPQFYEDELVYSLFARYHVKRANISLRYTAEDLFGKQIVEIETEFLNKLTDDVISLLSKNTTRNKAMKKIVLEHTMYKQYARFFSRERKKKTLKALVQMKGRYKDNLSLPTSLNDTKRYLRYCPLCVEFDRVELGETYWHRMHQLRGVEICPIHHCRLHSSSIIASKKYSMSFSTAESEAQNMEITMCEDEVEIKLAEYVWNVFRQPFTVANEANVIDFIKSKFEYTKYLSKTGNIRNMELFCEDFFKYYQTIQDNPCGLCEPFQIDKFFSGTKCNLFEVCQIAMFFGVREKEFLKMKLPKKSQAEYFKEEVQKLHKQGIGYNKIGEWLGVSSKTVRDVLK